VDGIADRDEARLSTLIHSESDFDVAQNDLGWRLRPWRRLKAAPYLMFQAEHRTATGALPKLMKWQPGRPSASMTKVSKGFGQRPPRLAAVDR
jgi:hypothetical protein